MRLSKTKTKNRGRKIRSRRINYSGGGRAGKAPR